MAKQPKTHKMSAGDILSTETAPGASTITGQHLMLDDKTAIDPGAEAQVVNAGKSVTVASGTTLCVFSREIDGEVGSIKIHATDELTLTGPMIWAKMPTVDVQKVLSKHLEQRAPRIRDFHVVNIIGMIVVSAFAYIGLSGPAVIMMDVFGKGQAMNFLWFLVGIGIGTTILFMLSTLAKYLLRAHREEMTGAFSRLLMVAPPNIAAFQAEQSTD